MADEEPIPKGREMLVRWFGPVSEVSTWRAFAYLLLGPIFAALWFVLVLVMLLTSLVLVLLAVGIPLTIWSFDAIDRMAGSERHRASLAGVTVSARRLRDAAGVVPRFRARIRDNARWRQVGYFMSAPVIASLAFAGGVLAWSIPAYLLTLPLWSWAVGLSWGSAIALWLVGLATLGLAPRVTTVVARASASYTSWLLGPDDVAAMRDRIDTLTTHRAEILDAVARERRRIERNLHDGVQQQLVALGIDLGLASSKLPDDPAEAKLLVDAAREKARSSIGELRVIGRGLHPAVLDDRGLDAALSAVVARSPMPIDVRCTVGPSVPEDVQETAYFVVSEAVSNILKHSRARIASVHVEEAGDELKINVHDDGVGGADERRGTGLAGIAARVRALDGTFDVRSPAPPSTS